MTTTTLSGYITQLGSLVGSYIGVLINDYLPILIGLIVVVGVVGALWYFFHKLFGGGKRH